MAEQLDPEDWAEIMDEAFRYMTDPIHRYDGSVAKLMGDGFLAFFGAPPIAHEDDPQRAILAALDIAQSLGPFRDEIELDYGLDFNVRIGINTGLVVVGDIGSEFAGEYTAMGDAVNLAARMEQTAEPGTVRVSEETHRLAAAFFEFEPLGEIDVKGKSQPVAAYRVVRALSQPSRIELAKLRGLTSFVGRRQELNTLRKQLFEAEEGRGAAIGIFGEAGVGKSRLLYEFRAGLGDEVVYLEGRCLPYGGVTVDQPIVAILRQLCGLGSDPTKQLLEDLLAQINGLEAYLPCFEDLLGLPVSDPGYAQLAPQLRKDRMLEGLVLLVQRKSATGVVVMAIEDLHWVDQTTEEFVEALVGGIGAHSVLMLLLARPEYDPPWRQQPTYRCQRLSLLPKADGRQMVKALFDAPVGEELERYIIGHAGGNPFFAEELTRELAQSGALSLNGSYALLSSPDELRIPETVQGVLTARMDKLEQQTRYGLQVASVIGQEFSPVLLGKVLGTNGGLSNRLETLTQLEFIEPRPEFGYLFKHAVTRDVAYAGLLKRSRKRLHRQVGEALKEVSPEVEANQPEVLAHHYTESGMAEEAIGYWQSAGQKTIQRSANKEAISYLEKALELLAALPDSPKRIQTELSLQTSMGIALMAAKGPGASEVEVAYNRARQICERIGDTFQLFPVLFGLWRFYLLRAKLQTAAELGTKMLHLAQKKGDPEALLEANFAVGSTVFWMGNLALAREHLQSVIGDYDPGQHQFHVLRFGQSPLVISRSYDAFALWLLGYPDQALRGIEQAIAVAEELKHPFSLAYALFAAAMVHQMRGEAGAAQKRADQNIALSSEHGFPYFLAMTRFLHAWSLTEQGQVARGIDEFLVTLPAWQATGSKANGTYYFALLAEAHGKSGQVAKGLDVVSTALGAAHDTGERLWEAELCRLKGELLLLLDGGDETTAEDLFDKAITIARGQGLLSLELRATMSMSRLCQRQGKLDAAQRALSECYDRFTEGFDTPDLKEARTFLDQFCA